MTLLSFVHHLVRIHQSMRAVEIRKLSLTCYECSMVSKTTEPLGTGLFSLQSTVVGRNDGVAVVGSNEWRWLCVAHNGGTLNVLQKKTAEKLA